jgi:TatA/E family protein of Tat protein translocase
LVIALVILGPKRLPAAGRSLGQALRELRDGMTGLGATAGPHAPSRGDRNEDA